MLYENPAPLLKPIIDMKKYRRQPHIALIGKNRRSSKVVLDLRITPLAPLTN